MTSALIFKVCDASIAASMIWTTLYADVIRLP